MASKSALAAKRKRDFEELKRDIKLEFTLQAQSGSWTEDGWLNLKISRSMLSRIRRFAKPSESISEFIERIFPVAKQ